jgi:hypothetical protein
MRELLYRARQFIHAVTAQVSTEELDLVQSLLPKPLYQLYRALPTSDQAHSLRVLRLLMEDGLDQTNLLQAALLHDLGKGRYPLRIWERIWVVVAGWLFPASRHTWGDLEPHGLKRALLVEARHASWGAEMIAASGGDEQLQRLIRFHSDLPEQVPTEDRELLIALQIADSAS